jgi:phosphopantothenoylcysteine decarboxylase
MTVNSRVSPLTGKTIVLGITGSIAAYKGADLASKLRQLGASVFPVVTAGARQFITPLTLHAVAHNPVAHDLWAEDDQNHVAHVQLADRADLLLVAPATANILAEFAHGLAGDFLPSLYLVCRAPVLIAPAMNGKMWLHPATQANAATLRQRDRVHFIGPEEGMLACGYEGVGRMWPVDGIITEAEKVLAAASAVTPVPRT